MKNIQENSKKLNNNLSKYNVLIQPMCYNCHFLHQSTLPNFNKLFNSIMPQLRSYIDLSIYDSRKNNVKLLDAINNNIIKYIDKDITFREIIDTIVNIILYAKYVKNINNLCEFTINEIDQKDIFGNDANKTILERTLYSLDHNRYIFEYTNKLYLDLNNYLNFTHNHIYLARLEFYNIEQTSHLVNFSDNTYENIITT